LKITFLGTGTSQGIPVIACTCDVCQSTDPKDKRMRSSILVEWGELILVVDTGPDFRQQMLENQVNKLDAALITHGHRDHVAGLDELRSFNFKQNSSMPLFGQEASMEKIRTDFSYIFAARKYPGLPKIDLNPMPLGPFSIEGKTIIPIEVMHYKLKVWGYRFGDFTYITDAKTIEDSEKKKIFGSKILVLNALQHEEHLSHLTLGEALDWIEEIKPEKAFLTHISHNLGRHKEVSAKLPDNVFLAWDGLNLDL
jgi:phosphoribosyl 1,2-cyclic phosphate phosphodiesterase